MISLYNISATALPIGHPAKELGLDYEIVVSGNHDSKPFYRIHYVKAHNVPRLIDYINSIDYTIYLNHVFRTEN